MSLYVQRDYDQQTAHLDRMTLRVDGFASMNARYTGGEMITKPFRFSGKELELNYSTSAAGSIPNRDPRCERSAYRRLHA